MVPLDPSYFATLLARLHRRRERQTHEVHRCCSPISRAAFNALTGVLTQRPRAKRFLEGSLRISALVNTIIATPIQEIAEYGSRNARHRHALDLPPKQVISLVPP